MGRFCPWSTKHAEAHVESEHMQAFSHFTYKYTNGELVACDFQGIYDQRTSKYVFTDSSIHSIYKLYGLFDQGEYGITEFFKLHKCNEICNSWPKPTPLTPPPSFEAACMLFHNLTPTSKFENIIYPTDSSETMTSGQTSERRRHKSDFQRRGQHEQDVSLTGHHTYQRWLSINAGEETVSEGGGQGVNQPSAFKNPSSARADDSQPPSYDSVVDPRSSSYVCGKNMEFKNGRERSKTCNDWKRLQRSATDPWLKQKNGHTPLYSDASCAFCFSNVLHQESHGRNTDITSNPVSYGAEATPSLVLPTAPPDEGDDFTGT